MIEPEQASFVISVHTEAECSRNVPQASSRTSPSSLCCHVGRITKTEGVSNGKGLEISAAIISVLTICGPAHGIAKLL